MGLFGGKKRLEDEMEQLLRSGRYDELLDLIYNKAILSKKIDGKMAIAYLKKGISAGESARANYILSLLLIPDKSGLKYAEKAFEMEPSNDTYAENLAMYYSEGMKDTEKAVQVYEKKWELTGNSEAGIYAAENYFREKNYGKAREICQRILVSEPNNKKAKKLIEKMDKKGV
jgi:tetratricopeptide (TPR) repeat protein